MSIDYSTGPMPDGPAKAALISSPTPDGKHYNDTTGKTSASLFNPSVSSGLRQELIARSLANRPKPLASLTAAASRITKASMAGATHAAKQGGWQEDAWTMYDLVGEERFLGTTLANRLGQARFFVGRLPKDDTEDVEPIVDAGSPVTRAFDTFHGGDFAQLIVRAGLNLFLTGDCYLVGVPAGGPPTTATPSPISRLQDGINPLLGPAAGIDPADLTWTLNSTSEVSVSEDEVTIKRDTKVTEVWPLDSVLIVRIWRPHPRRWWEADSPTRSSLPVLRELVGLTMHVSAQVDSRLAGAGLLLIPSSASAALRAAFGGGTGAGVNPDDPMNEFDNGGTNETSGDDPDPFLDALIEAMVTPITDRSSASAVVPLTATVPDEAIDKFKLISFASTLDQGIKDLRDEAIRRLALGQDCPPELLLGVSTMNHWGAWLVREDVVTTHLEPPLALISDALTTQLLWPLLQDPAYGGMTEDEAREYVVWYSVDHMIVRPDRSADAKELFDKGVISATALRDACGFNELDAPTINVLPVEVQTALDMLKTAPSLAQTPGLPALIEQIRDALNGGSGTDDGKTQDITPGPGDPDVLPDDGEGTDGAPDQSVEGPPDTAGQGTTGTPTGPGSETDGS